MTVRIFSLKHLTYTSFVYIQLVILVHSYSISVLVAPFFCTLGGGKNTTLECENEMFFSANKAVSGEQ